MRYSAHARGVAGRPGTAPEPPTHPALRMKRAAAGYRASMSHTAVSGAPRRTSDPSGRTVRPLWVLHGGPQADPLRRLLNHDAQAPYIAVSTRSVDRMTSDDVAPMMRLVNQADAFITERLPSGYRGLPVGVDDLRPHLRPGIPVFTFPRIDYSGLHPYQVGRDPLAGLADPPLVPYHDLRSVAVAAGTRTLEQAWNVLPSARFVREFAAWQLLRLRRVEARTDVGVAGAVRAAGMGAVHTVDRPGDALLVEIAKGIQSCLRVEPTADDHGIGLLGQCRGPVEPNIAEALGLPVPETDAWSMYGRQLTSTDIHVAQVEWYRQHPDVLKAIMAAHASRMDLLGLL